MGCDYYECMYLAIEYNLNGKVETDYKLLSKLEHWFSGTVDSDSEGDYDRKLEQEMNNIEKRYGKKIIYEDNKWLISSKDKIEEYKKYLPNNGQILKMYKYVSCEERG